MPKKKMDFAKILAMLAQPKEAPAPLENVERLKLEIPYITKDGQVETRAVRAVWLNGVRKPMPLIYIPHYEMGEDSMELRDYLAEGWAVACPDAFNDTYNAHLTDDDLVFNNAALYTLRRRPEFDRDRICLVGGSAGAYMAAMLHGLQLGHCAVIGNGVIANVYFNFYRHFRQTYACNLRFAQTLGAKTEEEAAAVFFRLPTPFIARLFPIFAPLMENFPEPQNMARWEAFSPVGLADCFGSPMAINHTTSDILVPVDQITRRFTYAENGESMPREIDLHLPGDLPGRLSCTLEECLPGDKVSIRRIVVPEGAEASEDSDMPFDPDKQFNINISDDGPPEGYGSHTSRMDQGRMHDVPYLRTMIARTARETCSLTPGMLKQMILRWNGKSVTLPAHVDVDDNVYGSLAIYRSEIEEELTHWIQNHGKEAFRRIAEETLQQEESDALTEAEDFLKKRM